MSSLFTDDTDLQLLHETIRDMCSKGWAIFPLLQAKKVPATPSGFKDAVCRIDEAISLFNKADYNIGIATGPSNLVVLDVDGEEGRNSLSALLGEEQLTATFTVSTRRGFHYYFSQPVEQRIGCSAGKIGLGLDIRGDGGYVVGPTSWVEADLKGPAARYNIIDDSPVAPLPKWLLEVINTKFAGVQNEKIHSPNFVTHRLPDTPRQRSILELLLSLASADCPYGRWRDVVWGLLSTNWPDAEQMARKWSEKAPHRFDEEAFYRLVNSYDDSRYTGCIISLLRPKGRAGL